MKKVVIYTTSVCPYCLRAKALFERKGIKYEEINVENDNALREKMVLEAGGKKTVPQIFIDNISIGGCDDLYALEGQGKLKELLEY
jgi:glutaredoxin 3